MVTNIGDFDLKTNIDNRYGQVTGRTGFLRFRRTAVPASVVTRFVIHRATLLSLFTLRITTAGHFRARCTERHHGPKSTASFAFVPRFS